ncbi:MAG: hypothetical protein Tsb0016_05840 [Sphingomonadales bacterium]
MMAARNFTTTTTAGLRKAALYLWLAAIALWMVFPFYYAIMSSLETGTAIFAPGLWPQNISFDNYTQLVRRQNIWHNSRRRSAECGPRLGLMFRRRACSVASADVRVSFA